MTYETFALKMSFCRCSYCWSVRTGVRRLVEEGVLYQVVKSGTYVTGFGAKKVSDAYEIRSVIESAMLKEACRAKNASLAVKWLQDHIARSRNDALLPVSQVSV